MAYVIECGLFTVFHLWPKHGPWSVSWPMACIMTCDLFHGMWPFPWPLAWPMARVTAYGLYHGLWHFAWPPDMVHGLYHDLGPISWPMAFKMVADGL